MTVNKQLYVDLSDDADGLGIIDDLDAAMNANMSGDRQIMVSDESLESALADGDIYYPEHVALATEILEEARKQECGDINIYC